MEKGDETLASPAAAAEKTVPIGGVAGDGVTAAAFGHPDKSYGVTAEKTSPKGSVAEDEFTVKAAEDPAKSYADVVADKTNSNSSVAEDDVTYTASENHAKSYADVVADKTNSNGSVAGEEVTATATEKPAKSHFSVVAEKTVPDGSVAEDEVTASAPVEIRPKSYASVAADAEMKHLRTIKRDLEEKLAAADRENKALVAETNRLTGIFSQAGGNLAIVEYGASSADKKALSLREELKELQKLLQAEMDAQEAAMRNTGHLVGRVWQEREVKPNLEAEIKALKEKAAARAAAEEKKRVAARAAPAEEERVAAPSPGALQGERVAWPVMAGAAAVGVAAAAVAVVIFLRLKR